MSADKKVAGNDLAGITSDNNEGLQSEIPPDTIPFRFLSLEEQHKQAAPFHYYGDLKLKMSTPLVYEYKDQEKGILIRESYPGVLSYFYIENLDQETRPYRGFKLEFYDELKQKLKSIDLGSENPFIGRGFKFIYGHPDMEYYQGIEQLKQEKEIRKIIPSQYYCLIDIIENLNGFHVAEYQLIPVNNFQILDWREVLVAFDNRGNELGRIEVDRDTRSSWVSTDGRYLAYAYGGSESADPISEEGFCIFDLGAQEIVYQQDVIPEQRFIRLMELDNGFLMLVNTFKNGSERLDYFFDLENRVKYSKHFSGEELKTAFENFSSYPNLMKRVPFKKENF